MRDRRQGPTRAEERRLLARARRGEKAALRRILELVSGPVYRFGRAFCRNTHDAEDVTQDVLTALVRSLSGFRGDASLSSWAYTVARHACGRRRRKRVGEPESIQSIDDIQVRGTAFGVADAAADPARNMERRELREVIGDAIAGLPAQQREVVLLRDVEGFSAKEVGQILGIGERAVKSRLHRARASLRQALMPIVEEDARSTGRGRRCPDTGRMLSRYLEGEIDAAACARMERHVARCSKCGAACSALRANLRSCRQWGSAPVPPEARARLREAIRRVVADATPAARGGPGG